MIQSQFAATKARGVRVILAVPQEGGEKRMQSKPMDLDPADNAEATNREPQTAAPPSPTVDTLPPVEQLLARLVAGAFPGEAVVTDKEMAKLKAIQQRLDRINSDTEKCSQFHARLTYKQQSEKVACAAVNGVAAADIPVQSLNSIIKEFKVKKRGLKEAGGRVAAEAQPIIRDIFTRIHQRLDTVIAELLEQETELHALVGLGPQLKSRIVNATEDVFHLLQGVIDAPGSNPRGCLRMIGVDIDA